ncbi:flagellar M-ring protein FliF [Helicobacter sp. MIT 00-7814]|uniref:flagellar basal-body MS-ring/collar protein FliF n=1 Tax=unclassified Helicobacter TaxID=2593540 RepID=UPI000E1F1452|nr:MULTISPECIES: flagellar basal-body MS-ring/collar protein FliF [unclassified Helicobacter]RDU52277.1 flagellar M-ring protein FliF [Helicobacter sp. MIT 00-7814]RDU52290.1 flagellar M-ring protein FliF [Helicobacter sp. MIT 99-10781]
MNIQLILEQIAKILKRINKRQRIIILATLVVIISFLTYLVLFRVDEKSEYEGYSVLFNGIEPQDSALILQNLQQNKIPYKIPADNTILVPSDKVYEQRIALASIGIPRQGKKISFSDFIENQNLGDTDFREQTKFQLAVEGELTKTIESITAIESASVLIAPAEKSVFSRQNIPPTASVKIQLRQGMDLTQAQIAGIKNLVAASVTNLTPDRVKIINQDGDLLGEMTEFSTASGLIKLAEQQRKYQIAQEKTYENKIIEALKGIVGDETRVRAQVSLEYDFSQVRQTQEIFGNNVVEAERNIEEHEKGVRETPIGGVPGVVSNIGPVQGLDDANVLSEKSKTDETKNYRVDRTVSEIKGPIGKLVRISAGVVVDGTYREVTGENGEKKLEYVPRSERDLKEIEDIVKGVVAYKEERGDFVKITNFELNAATANYKPKDAWESFSDNVEKYLGPFMPLIKYLLVGLVLFIFYKKIVAPFTERMLEVQEDEEEEVESLLQLDDDDEDLNKFSDLRKRVEDQLGLGGGFNEDEVKYEVILERMRNVVSERPEEVAALFQSLIKDELEISSNP